MNKGFTLIETIIYIALLGLMMSGGVAISYQLLSSAGTVSGKNTVQEEGSFALRKIEWALSGAKTITAPSGWGSALSLTRHDGMSVDVRFNESAGAIEIREGAGAYASTTTSNVNVSALQFHYIPASGSAPAGIEASTTIDGEVFYTKRYIRN